MRLKISSICTLIQCLTCLAASAQTADDPDVFVRAASLSNSGAYAAVVELLEPFVDQHPSSAEAWLLLAEHQYWSKDVTEARSTYTKALRHHPANPDLLLSFAAFLMETHEPGEARRILLPIGSDNADAEHIRGTLAWWSGDLTRAARHFKNAVMANSDHVEAASALASIREDARPWVRLVGEGGTDSQPLSTNGVFAEAGFFITPLQTISADVNHTRFMTENSVRPFTLANGKIRGFVPIARLETEIAAGIISRSESTDWTVRLNAGVRLPFGLRAGAQWERMPYLYTVASISEHVMTRAMQVNVSIDQSGWLGDAGVMREHFADKNTKGAVYGWLIAPLLQRRRVTFGAGYAYNYQNTAEHRFAPMLAAAPRPGQPATWQGHYDPYYTPLNQQTHSATGNILLRPSRFLTVRANGSYGFSGTEDTPFVYLAGRAPMTGVYNHTIHPWNVRGSIAAAVTRTTTIYLEGSHMATTWYDASTVGLSLYVRL